MSSRGIYRHRRTDRDLEQTRNAHSEHAAHAPRSSARARQVRCAPLGLCEASCHARVYSSCQEGSRGWRRLICSRSVRANRHEAPYPRQVADLTESTRCKKARCFGARRPQWPQREEACENATQPLLSSERCGDAHWTTRAHAAERSQRCLGSRRHASMHAPGQAEQQGPRSATRSPQLTFGPEPPFSCILAVPGGHGGTVAVPQGRYRGGTVAVP